MTVGERVSGSDLKVSLVVKWRESRLADISSADLMVLTSNLVVSGCCCSFVEKAFAIDFMLDIFLGERSLDSLGR